MDRFDAWKTIKSLSKEEFEEKIASQKLSKDRQDLLFKFIQGEIEVSCACKPDIEAYTLKCLMPDFYEKIAHERHPYSSSESYEYDPPKNGQNIIKHGIGFGEVVSYSRRFGTLLVPIPNERDGERYAILSDLDLKRESDELEIPPSGIREMNCTISIANHREGKFRFISARLLSSKKKKYEETIAQALGEITPDEQVRQGFIARCVEILERDLIQPAPPNTSPRTN
jgi:hypothetical protein